jgi:hypothetical protein
MAIYAKIENGEVTKYPLYEGDLQKEFPQYTFPLDSNEDINNGLIAPESYARIVHNDRPKFDIFSIQTEVTPTLVDGEWVQTWESTPMTAEQREECAGHLAIQIRAKRDYLLDISDKSVTSDRWEKYDEQTKREWADYRQALRDVTDQSTFPADVEWPIEPSVFVINLF